MKLETVWKKNKALNLKIFGIYFKYYLAAILCLTVLSLILSFGLGILTSFRVVFGTIYSLFLPGFLLSHVIFREGRIDLLERGVLSFVLSISVVPLLIFYLNLAGLRISSLNTFLTILILCLLSSAIIYLKSKKSKKYSDR
ncbi:DUF1616 domain-containing protein [Patescibacteria group bacterium]|nr:DUF1616 domain-containing protein [Patescibacteria group bacterium]